MDTLRTNLWRTAFVASGVTLMIGGSMHPDADASESMRQELATMTEHPDWWRAHAFIVVSTVLLAVGLWLADRHGGWRTPVRRPLRLAAIAVSAYGVETVFHLIAAVDTDALRNGDLAPVAFAHIGLALVLYPLSGAAIALLGLRTFTVAALPGKAVAAVAVVAGIGHALSVPLTVVLPDAEISPLFAGSAVLLAVWSVLTAFFGFGPSDATASENRDAVARSARRPSSLVSGPR